MRLLTTFTLLSIFLTAMGQTFPTKKRSWDPPDASFADKDNILKPLTFYPGTYVHTESRYADSTGIVVIIQNSVPRGGKHIDPAGKNIQYRVFWSRVINETATPLELTIRFSADSFAIPASPGSYLKVFLPPDTMTLDEEGMYDYGATGLKAFLDTGVDTPTMLQRTIKPREACLFYVGVLFGGARDRVTPRAGFVLKEQELLYKINVLDSALIPCGQIVIKNQDGNFRKSRAH